MPQITVLPHKELCPNGARFDVEPGISICDALLQHDVEIEHACAQVCACSTCHVILREGFDSLEPADDMEEDMLDKAWGLEHVSRLSCQAVVANKNLVVEIPKYTINLAKE